ncbi:YbjN domain-containing protein [Solimonas soli]|uniref:YbjN domain-containing protein n=1 Tax=Solimonas soli TaxID=413479 RepID=UPI0004810C2E|nr:YbjN domain-containing protein [Solimonas soli]
MSEQTENSLRALATLRGFLRTMQWQAVEQRIGASVALHVKVDGPVEEMVAQIYGEAQRFMLSLIFSGVVARARRAAVAELILRANWRLIEGAFVMDFDSGAVHYRAGLDFSEAELSEALVRNMVAAGMDAVEGFAAALLAVAEHGEAPDVAAASRFGMSHEDGA